MEKRESYSGILTISATILTIIIALLIQAIIPGNPFKSPFYFASMWVLFFLGLILFSYGYRKYIRSLVWQFFYALRRRRRRVGVLREEGCSAGATSFSSQDWFDNFSERCRTEFLSFIGITNKFAAIVNPYGEYYREDEYGTFVTFNRIRRYVQDGGIFVTTGGLAFIWAWRESDNRETMTSDEITGFGGEIDSTVSPWKVGLGPTLWIHQHSLKDTLLYKNFNMLTTIGDPEQLRVIQDQPDINFCGDLLTGEMDEVFEFRAAREPLPECYPMLRAQKRLLPNAPLETVYPLVAIPDGKGLFVFSGMAFDFLNEESVVFGHRDIAESQANKVVRAVINLIDNSKLIELDRKRIKSAFFLHRRPVRFLRILRFFSRVFS